MKQPIIEEIRPKSLLGGWKGLNCDEFEQLNLKNAQCCPVWI